MGSIATGVLRVAPINPAGALAAGAVSLGAYVGIRAIAKSSIGQYISNRLFNEHKGDSAGVDASKKGNYENPGHHDASNSGPNPYNPTKSALPKNHKELWDKSVEAPDGSRWTKVGDGKKSEYHRFQNDGNGNWHWNGSTSGVTKGGQSRPIRPNDVPNDIKKLPGT